MTTTTTTTTTIKNIDQHHHHHQQNNHHHHQDGGILLPPKLPVPPLHQTLERYLHAIQAVVPKDKYEITEKIVFKFGEPNEEGEFLQNKLVQFAKTKENWVYDWWLDDMYMKVRLPLPINVNPGMVFPVQSFKGINDLIRGELPQEYLPSKGQNGDKLQPLCMAQHARIMNTCRIPGLEKDQLVSKLEKRKHHDGNQQQHILVLHKRRFYVIDVIINGERITEENIQSALKKIVENENTEDDDDQIGILTADHRDRWAKTRTHLIEDKTNRETLDKVDTSLFVVCIDDPLPLSFNRRSSSVGSTKGSKRGRDDVNMAIQMLYGGGSKMNSANRWFDQTLQLIFSLDGVFGLCYEHTAAEGVVVIQLMDKLLKSYEEVNQNTSLEENTTKVLSKPQKLIWNKTNELKIAIKNAAHTLDKLGEDLDFFVLRFREYGNEFPKTNQMSPDAYIQLALQLTYYKVHRKLVSTYESASTRRFRLGRVDNIRAATPEALKWVQAVCGDSNVMEDEEKMRLFREALKTQTEIMKYNITGQGIDCHLLGLREIASDLKRPTPQIFLDESFLNSIQFRLSTSQVQTASDSFMFYGAVIADGYGASYNPHKDNIVFCISSFHSDDETNSELFAMSLESTLLQMREMIQKEKNSI